MLADYDLIVPVIQKFEDLMAWQKARGLAREIYAVSAKGTFAADFGLRDQVRKASLLVSARIAEGFQLRDRVGFIQCLGMAKGHAGEVKSQLYVALDQSYLERQEFDRLALLVDQLDHEISGFIVMLRKTPVKKEPEPSAELFDSVRSEGI